MIKYIKFYTTGSDVVKTFNVADNKFESDGETHAFTDFADAVAKSTKEVVTVWGDEVGVGAVEAIA